jgi:Ca2+-binding RTX toxin-like protein
MTDFVFDALLDGQRISFNAATDRLVVQDTLTQAGDLSLRWWQEDGAGGFDTSVRMTDGPLQGKTVILLNTAIEQLSMVNFSLAGGGFVLVGDNSPFSITDNQDNELMGGLSGDYIAGLAGNDALIGLAGDDTFDFLLTTATTYGHDTVAGGVGFDLIAFDRFGDALAPVMVNLDLGFAGGGYGLSDVTFTAIEAVIGTHWGDSLVGNGVANLLDAGAGADTSAGGAGNDTLVGGPGNDTLQGDAGIDLAVFSGVRANYTRSVQDSTWIVADSTGSDGTDQLTGVERLQFSDASLAFDLAPNQAANNTARIIGAAFDAPTLQQHPDWVGIGLDLFDSGQTMQQVCGFVVQVLNLDNTAFVNTVYENVIGAPPSPAELEFFVGLLAGNGGTMSQGQLLALAGSTDANALNINLVGLQQSGVEFA